MNFAPFKSLYFKKKLSPIYGNVNYYMWSFFTPKLERTQIVYLLSPLTNYVDNFLKLLTMITYQHSVLKMLIG